MLKINKSSYLAGLFEGDGHISICPNNSYNPRFNITFNSVDINTALFIKSWFNDFGFIRLKKRENAVVYTVSNLKGLVLIVNTINGKLRTPKIRQLNNLITYLNMYKNQNITLLPLDNSPLIDNSWLAGFSDADGCFDIRYTDGLKKLRIATRFRLDQRKLDPISCESYENILKEICDYLNINLLKSIRKEKEYLIINASSRKSILIVKNYFNNHTLLTSKYLNFLDWEKVTNMVQNNEHYTNKEDIKKIKNGMNNLRSYYNFDHLKHINFF
jgi:hypothetical protein